MLVRVLDELLGSEVRARESGFGRIRDLYFDRDCWQVSYLVTGERAPAMLISAACVTSYARSRRWATVAMSAAHLRAGAGAWPLAAAGEWLDGERMCSARDLAGCEVVAADGPAGVVADLLVDTSSWSVEYVLASTRELGARLLLLPVHWAAELDRGAGRLRMRCTRAELRYAPVAA